MKVTVKKKAKYYIELDQNDMNALMEIVCAWRDNVYKLLPYGSVSVEVRDVYSELLDASVKGKP